MGLVGGLLPELRGSRVGGADFGHMVWVLAEEVVEVHPGRFRYTEPRKEW